MSTHIKERVVGIKLAETRNSDNAGGDLARRSSASICLCVQKIELLHVCNSNPLLVILRWQGNATAKEFHTCDNVHLL